MKWPSEHDDELRKHFASGTSYRGIAQEISLYLRSMILQTESL